MDFVIQLLVETFNRSLQEAKGITMKIHEEGQGIAGTYSLEIAEIYKVYRLIFQEAFVCILEYLQ